ncbi:MAG: flagellar protein FlgN [Desulfobacula sp.]|nr:flagellar protein FlgN [Desulfobacula sp.]
MEKFAYKIEQLLLEKLSLYKKMQSVLIKEKSSIVDMDVESLWDTTARKKSLTMSIEVIKQEIVCLFYKFYSGLEMDTESLQLSYVIKILNVSSQKRAELANIHLYIDTIKAEISMLASENSKFINETLEIINSVFSTIVGSSDNENEYSSSGALIKHDGKNRLINAEV